jgi:glycosyltransferase involved in cell wall biosynthesis
MMDVIKNKYIVTVDLDLPPLRSGLKPYFVFAKFSSPGNKIHQIIIAVHRFVKLLEWAQYSKVMVLDSTSGPLHPDMSACILFSLFNNKPIVVVTGDMWNKGNPLAYRLRKMMIHLADPSIRRYVVQSLGEQKNFAEIWGIAPEKVRLCLYNFTFTDEEINAGEISAKGYIFAGGDPNRDYDLLLETARHLPNRQFIIASRLLAGRKDIPPNVKVVRVPHMEFIRLMREADAVVSPIRSGSTRAAGQQTYLNAMRMGKIVIVNGKDVFGVTDYIQDQVNGIIIDGTPSGYSKAIEWIYDLANRSKVNKIQRLARESVMQFTYERHLLTMASIIEEAVVEAGA